MTAIFITIQEAAELSGKSIQTIRRAIKGKKVSSRKKKTPQGYNYAVNRDSLFKYYKIGPVKSVREASRKQRGLSETDEYATIRDLKRIRTDIEDLMDEQRKSKDNFVRFMKTFQEKFVLLENQLKLLEAPQDKKWYQFWK